MYFTLEQSMAFVQNWGAPQILLILFIILLLFGAKKLPELARGMGKALREFKSATKDIEEDIRSAMDETDDAAPSEKRKSSAAKPAEPEREKEASRDTSSST
jgi:sec-independent protein translocase protein TatA